MQIDPFKDPILTLASASPRRQDLLKALNIEFICKPTNLDELPLADEQAVAYVRRMALEKAKKAKSSRDVNDPKWILAADTLVALCLGEKEVFFGKPKNLEEAQESIRKLSGKTHQVMTAFCLLNAESQQQKPRVKEVVTQVTLRQLSELEINAYLDGNEWQDKAGGYAIQEKGAAQIIDQIKGSFTNVIGLPLQELLDTLKDLRIWPESRPL